MLFFSGPVSPGLQKADGTKEGRRPETLKPITIDQCALTGGKKTALTCNHMQICLDMDNLVRSMIDIVSAHLEQRHCHPAKLLLPAIFHHPQNAKEDNSC